MILSAFKLASLAAFGVRNYFGFLTVGRGLGGLFICKQKNFIMYAIYETGVYLPSEGHTNIQISAQPGIKPRPHLDGRNHNNCVSNTPPNR